MGNDHTKPQELRHFQEVYLDYASQNNKSVLSKKKAQIEQFLESKKVSIFSPPDSQVIKTRCKRPTKPVPQKVIRMELNSQSIQEEKEMFRERFVNARDGRMQVLNTAKWPFSVHGLIMLKFEGKKCWGTGILIGPNLVLTAGNNLYDHEMRAYADLKSLQFLPAMNGDVLPFGFIEIEKYYVSPNYIKEEKENYGILILKEQIGEVTGYFGLACLKPEEILSKRINVTGYPYDKVVSKPCAYEMWGMEGMASHIDKDRGYINYLIDTEAGQGGGGVWYQEGDEYYVCGVHVSRAQIVSTAILLTRAIYEQIYNWLNQGSNSKWLFTLDSIERLEFGDLQIDADHLSFLMEYNLEGLETLNLFSKKIGPEGARILARNTSWINLSMLDLYDNQIGPKGCQALAKNTSWSNLSWLNLNRNNIGTEGAIALARNTSWTNLSKLHLESNNIESEGARALAQNTSWTKLSILNLASNNIDTEGAEALAKNSAWKNLKSLDLKDNDITPEIEAEIRRILAQSFIASNENPGNRIKIFW